MVVCMRSPGSDWLELGSGVKVGSDDGGVGASLSQSPVLASPGAH